jgi:hypothetical protein
MSTITDLLAIARTDLPADAESRRAALLDCESALSRCDTARDDIARDIAEATARRRELLLAEGQERAVAGLDRTLDALRADAERLDLIEEELVRRCHHLDAATRQRAVADLAQAYLVAVDAFASAARAAADARGAVIRVREAAVRAGHESRLGLFELPAEQFPLNHEHIARFAAGAKMAAAQMQARQPPPPLFPVRFLKAAGLHNANEVAGFTAEQAWFLVDSEIAAWHDPRRRPPRPAAKGGASA